MQVFDGRLTRLARPLLHALQLHGIFNQHHATAARGDDLVAVEAEQRIWGCGACLATLVGRAQRLGRILDQRHAILRAGRRDAVHFCVLTIEMHGNQRLRQCAAPRGIREILAHECRVDVARRRLAVDEHGNRALIEDREDRAGERECGNRDMITTLHADGA